MNEKKLIQDIIIKYYEHIEMSGKWAPFLVQHILAHELLKERQKCDYLEKRLNVRGKKDECTYTAN